MNLTVLTQRAAEKPLKGARSVKNVPVIQESLECMRSRLRVSQHCEKMSRLANRRSQPSRANAYRLGEVSSLMRKRKCCKTFWVKKERVHLLARISRAAAANIFGTTLRKGGGHVGTGTYVQSRNGRKPSLHLSRVSPSPAFGRWQDIQYTVQESPSETLLLLADRCSAGRGVELVSSQEEAQTPRGGPAYCGRNAKRPSPSNVLSPQQPSKLPRTPSVWLRASQLRP